jgi:hypothetical protein
LTLTFFITLSSSVRSNVVMAVSKSSFFYYH